MCVRWKSSVLAAAAVAAADGKKLPKAPFIRRRHVNIFGRIESTVVVIFYLFFYYYYYFFHSVSSKKFSLSNKEVNYY